MRRPLSTWFFWSQVLDAPLDDEDEPGDPEALLDYGSGPPLLFVRVPDDKVVKNRVHLDVQPKDRTRDAEVERLISPGATVFADHPRPDGRGWVTLADPEGNELCVETSSQERDQLKQPT